MSKRIRSLLRSYDVFRVLTYIIRNPKRAYISGELFVELEINENTWKTAYRPLLVQHKIINKSTIKIEDIDGRKRPFEFNKTNFMNFAFDNFAIDLSKLSKRVVRRIEMLRKQHDRAYKHYNQKYEFLLSSEKDLEQKERVAKTYFKIQSEIENSLEGILDVIGHPEFKLYLNGTYSYLDEGQRCKYEQTLKATLSEKEKVREKAKEELKNLPQPLSKNIEKVFDLILSSIETPKSIEKTGILYEYFVLTIEEIVHKEDIRNFKGLFNKIMDYWAINLENFLKKKELVIKSKIPQMTNVCLLNKMLK